MATYTIHTIPKMILTGSINQDGTYKLTFKKQNTSQFGYSLKVTIGCSATKNGDAIASKTLYNFSSNSVLDGSTYTGTTQEGDLVENLSDSKKESIKYIWIAIECGMGTDCAIIQSKNTNRVVIKNANIDTTPDKYVAGDITFVYNTCKTIAVTATHTKGGEDEESTWHYIEVFASTADYRNDNPIYYTSADTNDPDYSGNVDGTGTYILRNLEPNKEYLFVYTIDDGWDQVVQTTKEFWFSTSCMPTLTATAGTSIINANGSIGTPNSFINAINGDSLSYIAMVLSESSDMPTSFGSTVTLVSRHFDIGTNLPPNKLYYVHIIKYGNTPKYDYDSWTYVPVYTGKVTIKSLTRSAHATNFVKLACNCCALLYNSNGTLKGYGEVSTTRTECHFSFDNSNWVLIGTGMTNAIINATIPLAPNTKKTVYIRYRELDSNNNVLSAYTTSIDVASNVRVVRIGDGWGIPYIYTENKWNMAEATVYDSEWKDTQEATYDYTNNKWIVQ